MANQSDGRLGCFLSSCCQASSKASPVDLVVSLLANPQRSSSVRYVEYPYLIIGVIHEKVSREKTVAYSMGHSPSSTRASYAEFFLGQSHSKKNSTTDSPKPTQYVMK